MQFVIAGASLIALIIVHEFGHFIAAKLSGMRVDEFGIGYPPRAFTIATVGETRYTVNWLPFGGFVKIYGENGDETGSRSFSSRPRVLQAIVLLAGITMNLLFAYLLITGALIAGTPRVLDQHELAQATNLTLAVAQVFPHSPAALSGLLPGDSITLARDAKSEWRASDPKSFSTFVAESGGAPITLSFERNDVAQLVTVSPTQGLITTDPSRYAIGVEVATVGVVPLPFMKAVTEGVHLTWGVIKISAVGLAHFFKSLVTFSADFSQVAGPVGITVLVGTATMQGLGNLLSIIAIISVSLALINVVPIPALDGGRLLIVLIEGLIRRPIHVTFTNIVNMVAFALLIPLMIVVSAHDIFKLFH